jgi:hypothetical protein
MLHLYLLSPPAITDRLAFAWLLKNDTKQGVEVELQEMELVGDGIGACIIRG